MTSEPQLTAGEGSSSDRGTTLAALGVAILLCGVYLTISSATELWDRDEPRFCRAAVEMMRSGDYLVPRFNGDVRPHKPVLIYWLMNAGMEAFGNHEWVLRMPSAFGMALAALMTYFIARRMMGARTGLRSMIIFGTAMMPIYMGTAATADGTLIAWTTASVYPFVDRIYRGPRWWQIPAIALALTIAQYAKGPVGLAVPGLMAISFGLFARRHAKLPGEFWGGYIAAILASIGIFAAWFMEANYASGGELVRVGVGKQVVNRLFIPMEGHGGKGLVGYLAMVPIYIPVIFVGLFPWALQIPAMLAGLFRGRIGTPLDRAVIFCWVLPTFIMMSLVATKLPHYILPVFPPLAIAIAGVIERHKRDELNERDHKWLRLGVWIFVPMAIIGAIGPIIGAIVLNDWVLVGKGMPSTIVFALIVFLAVRLHRREQFARATTTLAVGFPAVMVIAALLFLPQLENHFKASKETAAAIRAELGDSASVCFLGFEEGSVFYYLNLPPDMAVRSISEHAADPDKPLFEQWAAMEGPGALLTTTRDIEDHKVDVKALGLKEIFRGDIINYAKGAKKQTILVLVRNAGGAEPAPQPTPPDSN